MIVDNVITQPKRVQGFFDQLPASSKAQISKRDGQSGP